MTRFARTGTGRRRRLVVGGCVAALLAMAAGTAYAVDNLPPKQPLVQDLHSQGEACATGDDTPYVAQPPKLTAMLYDPEEDNQPSEGSRVNGEFEAWWTDAAGAEQRRAYTTMTLQSGSRYDWTMPNDIPANTVVSWRVRANDGKATSPWSDEGDGSVCSFVYDDVSPEKATISSPEYPEGENWVDGVGVYGHFTMDSPSDDVVSYAYEFLGGPYGRTVSADRPGAAVTIAYLPLTAGHMRLTVRAIDRAGQPSSESQYEFNVKSGRAPVARWKLDDPAGSGSASAETGTAARAGTGVTFGGPAPAGTGATATVSLDGSDQGFLTTDAPATDIRRTFAVSAWVRPAETGRNMTVASQDADGEPGFGLGLRSQDDPGPVWSFAIAGARVSGGVPENGEWAHLLGLYDAETGRAQLYVNGHEVGTAAEATPAEAAGAFQIGRARETTGYREPWHGDIGDVQVHDRVVVPGEVAGLALRKPKLLGHWSLENAVDGVSPERWDGVPLRLGTGASIYRVPDDSCIPELDPDCPYVPLPLVGHGHLSLDGETGYAAADGPVVDTGDSFTLGVVVRLADAVPAHPMTVLSQAGEHTDAFKVRYVPSTYTWQLVMPEKDEVGAPEKVVSQLVATGGGSGPGHRLAVIYDDGTDTIKLYLDGQTNAQATASLPNGWHSTGALQIGRAKAGDGWGEYLHGDVDEVQACSGALRDGDVSLLGWGTDPPCDHPSALSPKD